VVLELDAGRALEAAEILKEYIPAQRGYESKDSVKIISDEEYSTLCKLLTKEVSPPY
jgi:hypothetical protein